MLKRVLSGVIGLSALCSLNVMAESNFTLFSNEIGGQLSSKQVFSGFGCTGDNISPALNWKDAPAGTKSFAVTVYDPDAPTGAGWWHWLMVNIPADTTSLVSDAGNPAKDLAPKGSIQTVTSYGQAGFGGACPPKGDSAHRYIFTVYALKTDKLDVNAQNQPALIGYMLNANALAKASIISYYQR
ncbi:YbhB/YbcL family Raf kinase inhibitor-like protein [Neptunicella marina]|uniref:YbhB/YbcL family Raf kinase inhibitor-like protein n=1 Tax=Neptunicella marina TaxID=2125989 RepID=A0A8J6IXR6_9ALTE|nr:YbhB/YbcL family Raf kinase inhibitor-like protein [Neptunicella marina]MBC3767839.1 YbhB/YbcL family Raf kinase inhibitor-like protein [Neptunicella marina]